MAEGFDPVLLDSKVLTPSQNKLLEASQLIRIGSERIGREGYGSG